MTARLPIRHRTIPLAAGTAAAYVVNDDTASRAHGTAGRSREQAHQTVDRLSGRVAGPVPRDGAAVSRPFASVIPDNPPRVWASPAALPYSRARDSCGAARGPPGRARGA